MSDLPNITLVWSALGGGPIRHNRARAFWRDGDGWNIRLKPDRGLWSDHATDQGGGILDLVVLVNGGTKADAYRWIADEFGLADDKPGAEDRRRWAERMRTREAAIAWRDSALEDMRDEMIRYYGYYNRGLRMVLDHGLDSNLGSFWAGVVECYEPRWIDLDNRRHALRGMSQDDLVAAYEMRDFM